MLDGLEHDPPTILASKFYETSKYYALTQHNFSPLAIYFSDATFNRMDPKLREGFLDAAKKAAADTRAHGLAVEKEALTALDRKGRHHRRMRQGSLPQARAAADRQFHQGAPRGEARRRHDPRDPGLRLVAMSVAAAVAKRRPPDHGRRCSRSATPSRRSCSPPTSWSSAARCCCASCSMRRSNGPTTSPAA